MCLPIRIARPFTSVQRGPPESPWQVSWAGFGHSVIFTHLTTKYKVWILGHILEFVRHTWHPQWAGPTDDARIGWTIEMANPKEIQKIPCLSIGIFFSPILNGKLINEFYLLENRIFLLRLHIPMFNFGKLVISLKFVVILRKSKSDPTGLSSCPLASPWQCSWRKWRSSGWWRPRTALSWCSQPAAPRGCSSAHCPPMQQWFLWGKSLLGPVGRCKPN